MKIRSYRITLGLAALLLIAAFGVAPSVYAHTQTPQGQAEQKLVTSDHPADDALGTIIDIDGDTMLAGSLRDAYIFERDTGGVWQEIKKLTVTDGPPADEKHTSFASLDGDLAAMVVFWSDVNGTDDDESGVYIFSRNQGGPDNWGRIKHLVAEPGVADVDNGSVVALAGDLLIVGAADTEVGGNIHQGAVYLYGRNQGGPDNWGLLKQITRSDGKTEDTFGSFVALSGDTLAVGAYKVDVTEQNQGAVYIYERNQGGADNWGFVTRVTTSDPAAGDQFGGILTIDGDTLIAKTGEPNERAGNVYIFERNAGGANNWGQVRKLIAPDGDPHISFGTSLALAGDTLLVGAPIAGMCGNERHGTAYVYTRDQGGADNWGFEQELNAGAAAGDIFGTGVAIQDDTFFVSAPLADGGKGPGAIYVNPGGPGRCMFLPLTQRQ